MPTPSSTPSKGPTQTVKITQQSLNLMRQIVAAVGWATNVQDMYIGGQLLVTTLPELDPLDWIKSQAELAALSTEAQKAYSKKDRAWTEKPVEFTLTSKQVDVFKKAFNTLVEKGDLAPNRFFTELITVFGLAGDE